MRDARSVTVAITRYGCGAIPVAAAIGMNSGRRGRRGCARLHGRLKDAIVATHSRDEAALRIRVDELQRLIPAQLSANIGWGHLLEQKQKVTFSQRLARKRMLRASLYDVRDVTVSELDGVSTIRNESSK